MFESVSSVALQSALDGLSLRQRAIADNVANIQTPGYHAKKVAFEDALSKAVSHGSGAAQAHTARSLEPTRMDGNNVNLDEESLAHIDTMMRYQLTIRALDGKYSLLREAIKGA